MAQVIKKDNFINKLSYSAPNVSLAANAIVTIGGQQYTLASSASVALSGLSANTRYQVFAVATSGSVSLVYSTNENSVGPAGYDAWKLVGSFMSNGLSSFGAFINIYGKPVSNWIDFPYLTAGGTAASPGNNLISAVTTAPTFGTIAQNVARWQVDGDKIKVYWFYRHTTAGTAGSGAYIFNLPSNLVIDTSKVPASTVVVFTAMSDSSVGSMEFLDSNNVAGFGVVSPYSTTQLKSSIGAIATALGSGVQIWGSSGQPFSDNANMTWCLKADIPMVGYSNTPIEER